MGTTMCRDQTPLSQKCQAKSCNKCGTVETPTKKIKPTKIETHTNKEYQYKDTKAPSWKDYNPSKIKTP